MTTYLYEIFLFQSIKNIKSMQALIASSLAKRDYSRVKEIVYFALKVLSSRL